MRSPLDGWRSGAGARGRRSARLAVLAAVAALLVASGYLLGRWTSGRSAAPAVAAVLPQPSPAAAGSGQDDLGTAAELGAPQFERTDPRPPPGPDDERARGGRRQLAPEGDHGSGASPPGELDAPVPLSIDSAPARWVDAPLPAARDGASVAIVIDDLGRSVEVLDELRALQVPLTYAVLPFETRTGEVAARLARRGEEILCHLPMAARHGVDPGPGALDAAMPPQTLRRSTRRALDAVPGAIGVNNHMGSALSADPAAMAAVLEEVRARGLFFLDSRTSAESVGYALARDLGLPAAERKVFLDGDRDPAAIRSEFRRLLALADRGEVPAIAIGHPYPETIAVLGEEIPRALVAGYRFVRVSAQLTTR